MIVLIRQKNGFDIGVNPHHVVTVGQAQGGGSSILVSTKDFKDQPLYIETQDAVPEIIKQLNA